MRLFDLLGVFIGISYPLLSWCIYVRKRAENRRLDLAEKERKLQFTLPEKDNEYIRSRLNTVLKADQIKKGSETDAKDFRFAYIKKLDKALKEKRLSPADRLKTEEYEGIIVVYEKKESWSCDEVETLGEVLSAVLKLSAKYVV